MIESNHSPPQNTEAQDTLLHDLIDEIGHYLPSQHPLDFFIHHNTLHAFEDLTFRDALQEADRLFGTHSLRKEADYFADFLKGRISLEDIDAVLKLLPEQTAQTVGLSAFAKHPTLWKRLILQYGIQPPSLGALSWKLFEQSELLHFPERLPRALQQHHVEHFQTTWNTLVQQSTPEERWWFLTGERDPLRVAELIQTYYQVSIHDPKEIERWVYEDSRHFALTSLWLHCMAWTHNHTLLPTPPNEFQRHRDVLLAQDGEDIDNVTHPVLLRFFSRFCDQGMSNQAMPGRQHGLLRTFVSVYKRSLLPMTGWLKKAVNALHQHLEAKRSPAEIIALALQGLQVEPEDYKSYLSAVVFSLRGWMGMIQMLEKRPDYLHRPEETPSLLQAVALQITLEWALWTQEVQERPTATWMAKPWKDVRSFLPPPPRESLLDAYQLFQCCLYAGISTEEFANASEEQRDQIAQQIVDFDEFSRSWLWHLAYERHYYREMAMGIRANILENQAISTSDQRPSFQLVCCIDEREESFRRHAEEIDPTCETLGVAGFFGIDMRFRGLKDAHYRALCPPVIFPDRKIREQPKPNQDPQLSWEEIKRKRRFLGWLRHQGFVSSRMPLRGFLWTLVIGILNLLPMALRILSPRAAKKLETRWKNILSPPIETYTTFLTPAPTSPTSAESITQETEGFTHEELLARVLGILRVMGLTSNFSPIVLVMGHGSTSLNNPHEAAHDCGACGGGRGGPNARIFAATLNTPSIREALRTQADIHIPEDTWFVGCMHDTCSDMVEYYELEEIPASLKPHFQQARATIDEARRRNAHERCRRFESVPLQFDPAEALEHVEGRSGDISEPRPEYGHATNALCLVGRRHLSRNLYLDRRSFLVSYNPSLDPELKSLTGLIGAVGPVCVGINLEYFFSYVNNAYYGSGTKLPHNISGYVGVINGNLSDLQTGLPWQMVEIHEPVRLLMFVEQSPECFSRVLDAQPYVAKLLRNEWLHIALIDPDTKAFFLWQKDAFVPWDLPDQNLHRVATSSVWYRGKRQHLPPVRVLSSLGYTASHPADCDCEAPAHSAPKEATSPTQTASAAQGA